MLLNTWLTAAKRHIFNASEGGTSSRRRQGASKAPRPVELELLEDRLLLTALTINDSNIDSFVDFTTGTLSITNAELGVHDSIVIERLTLDSTVEGISIDLVGVPLERLAIETVNVNTFTTAAIDINLENVTGLRTISIEDIVANGSDQAVDITLLNTDVYALTVEDSNLSGIAVRANGTSDITNGIITENQVSSGGIDLVVNGGATADNFHIVNNFDVRAANRDAINVSLTDSPLDGLTIENNVVGNEPGADVEFRAEGDTFIQPFELTNNAVDGELLQEFTLDLTPLGLVFDTDATFGQQFIAQQNAAGINTGTLTGVQAPVLSANNQILTLTFADFNPGETLLFVIDVDIAPLIPGGTPQDFSAFGRDLIGAEVNFEFGSGANSSAQTVSGTMVGDADIFNASQFVRGANASSNNAHGINLVLQNSPVTNASISSNQVTGVAGHGVQISTQSQSDVSAVFENNTIVSSSLDGIHFALEDSNFSGAIIDNSISNNGANGVAFLPSVSRTNLVEGLVDSDPIIITSTNHQLQTGDEIVLQGVVNDDPTVNHTANGVHTVTRIDNNRFSLDGVSGTASDVVYGGGGAWYVPDLQLDGSARGLVQIDVQSTEPQGRVASFQNIVAGDVQVTSLKHGLSTGDRIRIDGAAGTGISSIQEFKVTVIDVDTFALDGLAAVGPYDTSGGLATWTTNIVENAVDTVGTTSEVVITSQGHGLLTGDEVRVIGMTVTSATETVPSSANGRFVVTKLSDDTFLLQGSQSNGTYTPGTGYWVPFAEVTDSGDRIPQIVSGNSITENGAAGFFVDLQTGTRFNGDIVENTISANDRKGVHIVSHSFGLGTNLPLNPNDPFAVPDARDISFDVNIGTSATDGNDISTNIEAGVVIEALDFATGSFEINGNTINGNIADNNSIDTQDYYMGDGIVVRLASDLLTSESVAFISESIIEDNQIGVDSRGNQGNGLSFSQTDRTRIQDLEINSNSFLNSGLDGFHFVRTEDGDLNAVIFDGNDATNNMGDGFDIFAQNTVQDELDFRIRNSNIDNNGEYGIRIDVQADARVAFDLAGVRVRENGTLGNGFNPNDGAGAEGQSGGIGLHGFQQVDIDFTANDVQILDNIGDGFSVDAEVFFDTLQVDASFIDSELSGNSLTGFRSVGAAFASYEWTRTDFIGNGTDGARIVSNIDTNDFFNRRVGGQDIDVIGLGNNFQLNGDNGVVLGMGVSAVFGNGDPTQNFANEFGGTLDEDYKNLPAGSSAGNGEDGLKIVQEAGPYLRNIGRRRIIETDGNVFTNNTGDGVDIGHFVQTEGGNVLHGDEVISDVDVIITRADLSDNGGDGVEYLADSIARVTPGAGSGQDGITNPDISSLSISSSSIKDNGGRGVDILNRVSEDSRITLLDNEIIGNTQVGIYVVNTTTHDQLQASSTDPLEADYGDGFTFRDPNIELRIQDNLIESNGTAALTTTVPINDNSTNGDTSALANPNFAPITNEIQGTIGGLVIRVGTAQSIGFQLTALTGVELSLAGIDAEVWKNSFDGNFGADVYFDNFVSAVPDRALDRFGNTMVPQFRWNSGVRDPLARLDLVFRENEGNSLDVINGFAFLDNNESLFKRRTGGNSAPGPFGSGNEKRNATRTLGFNNVVGDDPSDVTLWGISGAQLVSPAPGGFWSYDGWGTPTWRVESDFDFGNFDDTSPIFGLSSFFDTVNLGGRLAEEAYQWDTGVNVPGFTGATPYSLQRGDIFNVQLNEAPIAPDQLEENDSFLGATQLLTNPITGEPTPLSGTFVVNDLTTDGNLNIERKGDRDYYSFVAAASGTLQVNLSQTDALGAGLSFLIYEVDEEQQSSEVPLFQAANGVALRTSVNPTETGLITVTATAGRTYIVEVISDEATNNGLSADGKNFSFGTVRSYTLSIDAPIGPAPVLAAIPAVSPLVESASAPGVLAGASIAGQNPSLDSITTIAPDPISTAVNTITVHFDEDVTGVDRTDFTLTRNTLAVDTSGIIVSQIDAQTYAITNLAELTNEAGSYAFSLVVAGSNIIDTDSAPLMVSGLETTTWVLDNTVTFFGDSTDNIPGDGDISDVNGNRSLRAAINEANANTGNDVIELAAGTYTLSLNERFEDEGLSGDLDIRETLTIRGTGSRASDTVIDANQIDRVFHVFPGVELILENLTITGGEAFDGAGLFIEGSTTTSGITGSSAGIVRMTDVNVIDNEAYNQGGGIYNLGTVEAVRSSISRNIAGSRGGGIFNHGVTDLLNVTVSSNFAVSRGGGIYNEVQSSAINAAIQPVVAIAELTAVNSTIAFNRAESAGGGLFQEGLSQSVIGNTIIDQNTALESPNLSGIVNSQGYNFVGDLGVDAIKATFGLVLTDIIPDATAGIVDAGLLPLTGGLNTNNGTWVHELASTAHVIDRGSNAVYAAGAGVASDQATLVGELDQTQSPRLVRQNDNPLGDFFVDIGASEFFLSQPIALFTATPNPAGAGETVIFDGSSSTHSLVPGSSNLVSYAWDFTYDGTTFIADVSGASTDTTSFAYSDEGIFDVALQVTDNNNITDIFIVTVVVSAPLAPVIQTPFADGTSDSTPTISWTGGSGQFELIVINLDTGLEVINEPALTTTSFTPTTRLAPGQYQAIVTAFNDSGSESSVPYNFEVIRIAITNPTQGSLVFDTTPEFTFTAIPDAATYQIFVAEIDPNDPTSRLGVPINVSGINAEAALIPGTDLAVYEAANALPEGFYFVWVRAFDADGNAGDWSIAPAFTVTRPTVTGPAIETMSTIDSTPTITWSDVGANQYQVWLSQLSGTTADGTVLTAPQLTLNTVVSGTSLTVSDIGNGEFRVWVRALGDDGEAGLWSEPYDFTRDLTSGPDLLSPILGVNETDRTPTFTWEALDGATHYEIWVNNQDTGASRVIQDINVPHVDGVTEITFTDPDTTLFSATYRWWVRAFNEDGAATDWSTSATFFVPVPVIDGPTGTVSSTNLPTFSWTGVDEYVSYELWVNNLDTGESRVIFEPEVTDTSFTPTLPLENGTFRFWVRGTDIDGNVSQYSVPVTFTVDSTISSAPALVSPSATTNGNQPEFVWTPAIGNNVSNYEILVKQLLGTSQPTVLNQVLNPAIDLTLTPGADTTLAPVIRLNGDLEYTSSSILQSGSYRWWVRGLNADGTPGPWSQPLDFLAATDGPQSDDNDVLSEPSIMVASLDTANQWSDELVNITVHPAAVVALMTEPAVESAATDETAAANVEVDQVMEELATADWWRLDSAANQQEQSAAAIVQSPEADLTRQSETAKQQATASVLGLAVAAGVTRRRPASKRDED